MEAGDTVTAAHTSSRAPDVEKALMHLSAAAVEADLGIADSTWAAGETPNPAWWAYCDALESIQTAERRLLEAKRRSEVSRAS
jgi:hypothetical protein